VLPDSPAALGGFTSTPRAGALSPAGRFRRPLVPEVPNPAISGILAIFPENGLFPAFPGVLREALFPRFFDVQGPAARG